MGVFRDTTLGLLEASMSSYYKQASVELISWTRVEVGPNTSSVTRCRRRRRKGKSQIWDSNIRLRVPRDSDTRMTALVRASSIYKRETRFLVREGAPQKQGRNCQTVINILSWAPDGARHQDLLLTDRQSQCDFDLSLLVGRQSPASKGVNTRAQESTAFEDVTRQWLKIQQTEKN
jgi:hypothetical protein